MTTSQPAPRRADLYRDAIAKVAPSEWLCLLAGLFLVSRYAWLMDDAFVYFRYLDNALFLGLGLVYNEGEFVEGYSSPAWILLIGLLRAARIDYWHIVLVVGFASYVAFWVGMVRLSRRLNPQSARLNLALIYLTANYAVLTYFTSGLESPLVQLWAVFYALAIVSPRSNPLQLALAFSPLVRHELAVPLLLWCAWSWYRTQRIPWRCVLMAVSINGAWVAFRVFYYADLFPNTYHLKNEFLPAQGLVYLRQTLSTYYFGIAFLFLALLPLVWLRWKRREGRLFLGERGVMLATAISVTLFVVKIGGDPRHYRFLAFPFCLAVCSWSGLGERALHSSIQRSRGIVLAASALLYLLVATFYPPQLSRHPFTGLEKHRMVEKINDASWHRRLLRPDKWRREIPVFDGGGGAAEDQLRQTEAIATGMCVKGYFQYTKRVVNLYGLTDSILARVDTPSSRPAHKPGLQPLAEDLVAAQNALGWCGRGMYRAIVAEGLASDWIERNLEAIEILEKKIYNRHELAENLRLALTPIDRLVP